MGTKFSLKDPNPGVWFTFDPNNPESGRICLRVATMAKIHEIDNLTAKWEWKDGKKVRISADYLDPTRLKMYWDYCIVAWDRLEDHDDTPLECTAENKFRLMSTEPNFAAFFTACISLLNKEIEDLQEKVRKN